LVARAEAAIPRAQRAAPARPAPRRVAANTVIAQGDGGNRVRTAPAAHRGPAPVKPHRPGEPARR
ncbi:hypothetical protein NON00_05115, partial [Roseomonas sp. GC11]|uniref:hypothetical protein n=1 Tax=Roseomonas sp. GC11 TaxID=2950546 RepID=UPI00210A99C7